MPIYLVTNKVTHSRMVVCAPNPERAREMHPTLPTAVRKDGYWATYHGSGLDYREARLPPPVGWPLDIALVHADLLAEHEARAWVGTTDVLAFEPSTTMRRGGTNHEGPDDTWGGYSTLALTYCPARLFERGQRVRVVGGHALDGYEGPVDSHVVCGDGSVAYCVRHENDYPTIPADHLRSCG